MREASCFLSNQMCERGKLSAVSVGEVDKLRNVQLCEVGKLCVLFTVQLS